MKTLKELESAYDTAKDLLYVSRKSKAALAAARKVCDDARAAYLKACSDTRTAYPDTILAEKNDTSK